MLEIKNLTKSYGKNVALCSFSYSFENGIYAILGPNGAGKSTLFHLLTLNLKADSGEIKWEGRSTSLDKKAFLGKVGFIPQQQNLYTGMTLDRFLWYMAALKGIDKNKVSEEVEYAIKAVNLVDVRNHRLGTFSGGMKQRALIAQALLGHPKILICDEPTAGLDPKERVQFKEILAELGQDSIILVATHIVSDVENLAKEVIILKNGSVVEAGYPAKLCEGVKKSSPLFTDLECKYMEIFG